jgi:HSP20 family protein
MAEQTREQAREHNSAVQTSGQGRRNQQLARRGDGEGEQLPAPLSSSTWLLGSPFDLMRRFNDEMQGFFGHGATWEPNIEVFQRANEFVIRADLPGMDKGDVIVDIADDAVTIRGERREDHEEEHDGFYRSERVYGSFYRVIPLPEGAIAETAKATFRNGVLEIVVQAPPREVSRGRRVEIEEGKSNSQQRTAQGDQQRTAQGDQQRTAQSDQQRTAQGSQQSPTKE